MKTHPWLQILRFVIIYQVVKTSSPMQVRILMWPLTYHYLDEDVGILETHVQATITMDDASVQSLV